MSWWDYGGYVYGNSPRDRNITSGVSRSSPKTESKRHDEISPRFKPLR